MAITAAEAFRDYETDGVPSSGSHKIKKSDMRNWGAWVEGLISAFTANGGLIFSSKATLDASLAYAANTMAWVIGDATTANNGVYGKVGASGVGSWTRRADLPFSFIIASDVGAGTPNAIQATTSIPVSGSALVWMNIFEANTASPVTVSFNGGSTLTIKTNAGNDVAVGGLVAGMIVLGIVSGSTFRLVSDQASAAIVAAAEAAADRAEAAAAALPTVAANTMLVDNAAGTTRETKSFGEVRLLLEQPLSSGMATSATAAANAAALAAALTESAATGLPVQPAVGTIPLDVNALGEVPSQSSIVGLGPYQTTIERSGTNPGLNVDDGDNVTLSGFTLNMKYSVGAVSGHAIRSEGANNLTVENARLLDFAYDGVDAAGGTGVLVAAVDDLTRPQNPRLRDLHIEANSTGSEAFGWIFDRTDNGFVRDVYSKGAVGNTLGTGMAHELKNVARYSIMAGLNAEASSIGLGFGQQSAGTFDGATNNIFMGLLAHGCDAGFVSSKGQGNLGVGMLYALDTGKPNTRTKYAMQFDTDSRSNAVFASFASSTVDAVADFEDGARYNYAQFYSTVTGNVAKFQTGTTRNVVDVVHPGGTESSILGLVSDTSGSATRGSAANVVYSHATGERIGSLSGAYHDRLEASGAAWNAAHYWRKEALNNVIQAHGTNGASGNIIGIQHSVPTDANRAGFWSQLGAAAANDFWALRGWGGGNRYIWEQNDFRPAADNVISLGLVASRWSVVYAGTGTINTSDANEKTAPLAIDDAVLDAWGDVRLVCFQWLDAIAKKGEDGARIHIGVIAQQVRDAFEAHGVDGLRYGLLCYDKWDEEREPVYEEVESQVVHQFEVVRETNLLDSKGQKILAKELETRTEIVRKNVQVGERVVLEAGERWGIREGQCLFLEAAYMRRRCEQVEARLGALEAR